MASHIETLILRKGKGRGKESHHYTHSLTHTHTHTHTHTIIHWKFWTHNTCSFVIQSGLVYPKQQKSLQE